MSTQPNHGGPAFPAPFPDAALSGMSVRQWYKGMATAGLIASEGNGMERTSEDTAKLAGVQADYLLAEDAAFAERAKGAK